MTAFGKFFGTSSWIRNLVIVAIVVLVGLLLYWWRSTRKTEEEKKLLKQFNEDFITLTEQSGQEPTYLATNYSQFADKIYEAGCAGLFCYGTDEQAIYDVFDNMQNDLDVLLLVKAFGMRQPRGTICVPIPGTGECDYSLSQWLETELESDEFKNINDILSKKSITYRF